MSARGGKRRRRPRDPVAVPGQIWSRGRYDVRQVQSADAEWVFYIRPNCTRQDGAHGSRYMKPATWAKWVRAAERRRDLERLGDV
jgi:hypothetical protein